MRYLKILTLCGIFVGGSLGETRGGTPEPNRKIPVNERDLNKNVPFDKAEEAPEDRCRLQFDAATNFRNEFHFIKDTRFWRILQDDRVYPAIRLEDFWGKGFPNVSHFDAIFMAPHDQSVVFISGKSYWKFDDPRTNIEVPPKSICDDFEVCGNEIIRAAFVWNMNWCVYLIGTTKYWKLTQNLHLESGYPKDISSIKGLPRDLDGAVEDKDGQVYFLQGPRALKLNNMNLEVDHSSSVSISEKWFGCTNRVIPLTMTRTEEYHVMSHHATAEVTMTTTTTAMPTTTASNATPVATIFTTVNFAVLAFIHLATSSV